MAKELPKEDFKRVVNRWHSGKKPSLADHLFQVLQEPVAGDRAGSRDSLDAFSDKSHGYCLEMICADFLAGAALETGGTEAS
jgi:hypothetical protein